MPVWLIVVCSVLVILSFIYLLYVVLRPEDF
ncbi:MAG TPA: potassium-transporting ATPase subunit F [Rhodanobacteraceae bacterium]|nr:potassium-transporting ATPase subunit F [Rhodanobacteraceae bacterium]